MKFLSTLLFTFLAFTVFSQSKKSTVRMVPNQIIVQLEKGTNSSVFFQKIKTQLSESGVVFQKEKQFSKMLNLFLLKSDGDIQNVNTLLENLRKNPEVKLAEQNFQIPPRETMPNDPQFTNQWDMERIKAPAVWDITTGGVTALGDTIVVAQMESGDWRHDDLVDNRWVNWNEINNDGIDNDGNGYIDDFFGWNVIDSNDVIGPDPQSHGLGVSGIIGATGNNEIGVSGVNWNVKIMWVHNNLFIDKIIEGYEYVYNTRKLYNDTNGEKGAFVVATNGSFGVSGDHPLYPDGLQIDDNPLFGLWCDIHEMLGTVGVLNVGSTDNSTYDVDEIGDMPSICPTDHLIVVAESNKEDKLNSAFGKTTVDLAAPGDASPTTWASNTYSTLGGTSAAAPHVAGGIALLYSIPCEKLAMAAQENPAATALLMKDIILGGVDEFSEMEDKTVSGGRLNLEKSMELINDYCGSKIGVLNIDKLKPNPADSFIEVEFTPNEFGAYRVEVVNSIGQKMFELTYEAKQFLPTTFRIEHLDRLKTGIYFIRISNDSDYTSAKFFVY